MPSKENETILCITADAADEKLIPQPGLNTHDDVTQLIDIPDCWFAPRKYIEAMENYKQIIPYIVLTHDNKLVVYQRTSSGGEGRLHDKYSIGFGGHIGLEDVVLNDQHALDIWATIETAGTREVAEELDHPPVINKARVGVLYDDGSPVSRVHLGIVEFWELDNDRVTTAEEAVAQVRLMGKGELTNLADKMEDWSQICLAAWL
jgi:predicted NUDIX family phosphoesterase